MLLPLTAVVFPPAAGLVVPTGIGATVVVGVVVVAGVVVRGVVVAGSVGVVSTVVVGSGLVLYACAAWAVEGPDDHDSPADRPARRTRPPSVSRRACPLIPAQDHRRRIVWVKLRLEVGRFLLQYRAAATSKGWRGGPAPGRAVGKKGEDH